MSFSIAIPQIGQFCKTVYERTPLTTKVVILGTVVSLATLFFSRLLQKKEEEQIIVEKEPVVLADSFRESVNQFAGTFYQECSQAKPLKNFIYLTPNILSLLSMIYAGAPTETKKEFVENLFKIDANNNESWFKQLNEWLNCWTTELPKNQKNKKFLSHFKTAFLSAFKTATVGTKKLICQTSQAIFQSNTTTLSPQMANILPELRTENFFFDDASKAKTQANEWVAQKTHGDIKTLIDEVKPETLLIMLAATVFKGDWVFPFEEKKTKANEFTNADGTRVSVPMMQKKYSNNYRQCKFDLTENNIKTSSSVKLLEMDFHGDVSMILALPNRSNTDTDDIFFGEACCHNLDLLMNPENLERLLATNIADTKGKEKEYAENDKSSRFWQMGALSIGIPKIELDEKMDLLNDIPSLNMLKKANFQGTLVETESEEPVVIDQIASQALFKMDETGVAVTQASFATGVAQSCPPTPFWVDRPFACIFFDKKTQTILGAGRVAQLPDCKINS